MDSIGDLGVAARVADLKAEVRYKLVFDLMDVILKDDPFSALRLRPLVGLITAREYMSPEDLYFLLKNKSMAIVLLELEKKIEFFEEKERESLLPSVASDNLVVSDNSGAEVTVSTQNRKLASEGHVLAGFSRKISTMLKAVVSPDNDSSKESKK